MVVDTEKNILLTVTQSDQMTQIWSKPRVQSGGTPFLGVDLAQYCIDCYILQFPQEMVSYNAMIVDWAGGVSESHVNGFRK